MRRALFLLYTLLFSSILMVSAGCSSFGKNLKSFLNGEDKQKGVASDTVGLEKDNMRAVPQRQYGRMTRQRLEEEAHLGSRSGSLWVPEGQGAYLFSENTSRMMGDLLNIKLDGSPKEQIQAKAKVIRDLLKKIDAASRAPAAAKPGEPAKDGQAPATPAAAKTDGAAPAAPAQPGATPVTPPAEETAEAGGDDDKIPNVELIPTRVVERLNDGNYRVEGSQGFMIGKREYRVVVAGVIRAQDFNDEGVNASRLLDPRFDIVSAKKGAK